MAQARFWKRTSDLTKLEETFAKNLNDVENSSTELKKDLKNLLLDSVKEVEVFSAKQQKSKNVLLVTVPFVCHKILARLSKFLTVELERKTKTQVFFLVKRKIDSKWITVNKTQRRPRSHTLTSVFESTLDDLCSPSVITGKRIRCRLDGSRLFKIHLDEKDRDFMAPRIEALSQIYKKITTRELAFEFRPDHSFLTTKK